MIGVLVIQILIILGSTEPSIVGILGVNGIPILLNKTADVGLFYEKDVNNGVGNFEDISLRSIEKIFTCEDMNSDVCGCVEHNCSFHVAGGHSCVEKKSFCEMAFSSSWQGECRKENSFYSIGGNICHNKVQKGDCGVDQNSKSNFGVNLNGHGYTDSHGVKYIGQNETQQPITNGGITYKNASFYGTSICKREGRGNIVNVISLRKNITTKDIQNLMWGYVESEKTTSNTNEDEGCLSFQIDFQDDGLFELNLKIAEMEHFRMKYRQFNVKFNGKLIFPEVDIALRSGRHCFAVDLVMNFRIFNKQSDIEMNGFLPMDLTRKSATTLELCPSICEEPIKEKGFTLSAFSVTKLGTSCQH